MNHTHPPSDTNWQSSATRHEGELWEEWKKMVILAGGTLETFGLKIEELRKEVNGLDSVKYAGE